MAPGYIYKRHSQWYVQYYESGRRLKRVLRTPTGKPCANRKEAEIAAALLRAGYTQPRSSNWDILELDKRYIAACGERLSQSLLKTRVRWMHNIYRAFPRVSTITHERLGQYARERLTVGGVSTSTVNRELAQLRRVLNWAVSTGKLERSPMAHYRLLPEPNHRERILSGAELERLLAALENPRHQRIRLIVLIALYTGMRYGEIVNLAWADVNLATGEFDLLRTKSGRRRRVPIPGQVFLELQTLPRGGSRLFPWKTIRKSFASLLREAEIIDFRFHDLRHTAASWMLRGGVDINTVREILGHSSISTTQRYLTSLSDQKREAVNWVKPR